MELAGKMLKNLEGFVQLLPGSHMRGIKKSLFDHGKNIYLYNLICAMLNQAGFLHEDICMMLSPDSPNRRRRSPGKFRKLRRRSQFGYR